jgi:hypothetical protein
MEIGDHWEDIRKVFDEAYKSCLHYAVASVNADGSPHVTPIGGLFLRADQTGFYFDEFPTRLDANIKANPRVCILAVNSDKKFWVKSLFDGKFSSLPGVRLLGTVGGMREATADEKAMFQKNVGLAKGMKGYKIMWENMHTVRDIKFDSYEPIYLAEMTAGLG